jgi:hypothetical protein
MYSFSVTIYAAILFFLLSPGVLLSLPPKSSTMTKAAVHSLVFALIFYFTYGYVWRYFNPYPAHRENMTAPAAPKKKQEGLATQLKKK